MIPVLMVVLIMESESSDCVQALEQMLSSVSSAANRPLGRHNPSFSSPPTSHCVSTRFVLLHLFQWLLDFFVFAEDWLSLCPYDCTVWENNDFLSFGLSPIDQVLAKSAPVEETEEEANWWPADSGRQSWRYWQENSRHWIFRTDFGSIKTNYSTILKAWCDAIWSV